MRRLIALLVMLALAAAFAAGCGARGQEPGASGLHSSVPNLVGMQQDAARSKVEEAGYVVGSVTATNAPDAEPGTVVEQSPLKGTSAPRETAVNIVISSP
ncbi:MAG: PASTA domain-containing protein [Coriobacteriales bacterium]|nr:PASTA domain-containing protein [Coriobacteriales bacterium]